MFLWITATLLGGIYLAFGDDLSDVTLPVLDMDVDVPPKNDTIDEGETMEEEWVREEILNLAYYIRSHKFNEYDRRYKTEKTGVREFYKKFPDPPLRTFHWDVKKFCSISLTECLRYTHTIMEKVKINRTIDTVYVMKEKNWTFAKNKKAIQAADKICRRLYKEDWEIAEPFQGPLQRFQWRTTVSYFMCKYTLQGLSALSVFGEQCDNYASCLWSNDTVTTADPRANDSEPFACAKYSFCPDRCCPLKNISDYKECMDHPENPCPQESKNRTCSLVEELNHNVKSLSQNHWNLSCTCDEKGFIWNSRFGICVDEDECETGASRCNNNSESCLNLRGNYSCICSFGYRWSIAANSCVPMAKLMADINSMDFVLRGDENQTRTTKNVDTDSKAKHPRFSAKLIIMLLFCSVLFK